MSKFGRKRNGRSGACEAGNLPLDRRSVIGRFRPKNEPALAGGGRGTVGAFGRSKR